MKVAVLEVAEFVLFAEGAALGGEPFMDEEAGEIRAGHVGPLVDVQLLRVEVLRSVDSRDEAALGDQEMAVGIRPKSNVVVHNHHMFRLHDAEGEITDGVPTGGYAEVLALVVADDQARFFQSY